MNAREITRPEWPRFFDHFSRLHCGAIVSLDISSLLLGKLDAIVGQPLSGVSADGPDVLIHISGGRRTDHLGHRIPNVRKVRLRQTAEGADAALDLEAGDGTQTTVRFRSPMLPEMLERGVE